MKILRKTKALLFEMAEAALPDETGGVLYNAVGGVLGKIALYDNAAGDKAHFFTPPAVLPKIAAAWWHSHPLQGPIPSLRDVRTASRYDMPFVIVSLDPRVIWCYAFPAWTRELRIAWPVFEPLEEIE